VQAFASGDLEAYFDCFAEDAVFVFHTTDRVLTSTAQYRELWQQWVSESGFAIETCHTSEQIWQVWEGAAVLAHRVATTSTADGEQSHSDERETIVFAPREGRWLAVHEHLSLHPAPSGDKAAAQRG
jgi:ketosteroid isomerase-like protein